MKRLACALVVLAIGFAVSPARADYALVRFEDGWCRIWWDSAGTPWGVGWTKIAIGDARLAYGLGRAEHSAVAGGVPVSNVTQGAFPGCGAAHNRRSADLGSS